MIAIIHNTYRTSLAQPILELLRLTPKCPCQRISWHSTNQFTNGPHTSNTLDLVAHEIYVILFYMDTVRDGTGEIDDARHAPVRGKSTDAAMG